MIAATRLCRQPAARRQPARRAQLPGILQPDTVSGWNKRKWRSNRLLC